MNRTNKRAAVVARKTFKELFPGRTQPTTTMGKLVGGGAGEYRRASDSVGLARSTAKALSSRKPMHRKEGQLIAAHEYAHSQQNPGVTGHVAVEGGAEAFARRYGKKKLGLTKRDYKRMGTNTYSGAAGRIRKRVGARGIMKDQFRGTP